MKGTLVAAAAWTLVAASAQDLPKAPVAANPVVELRGRISKVEPFRPREGMPALEVESDGSTTTVVLGSMRYLMEKNFNPKAGTEVQVKAYKLPSVLIAIEVKLTADGRTLRLRDENGWPLWRGRGGRWRAEAGAR